MMVLVCSDSKIVLDTVAVPEPDPIPTAPINSAFKALPNLNVTNSAPTFVNGI